MPPDLQMQPTRRRDPWWHAAESVRVSPGDTAFTNLAFDSYPWSHSLLMAIGWSVVIWFVGQRVLGSAPAGWLLGGLVLSHWVLDVITHRPDLPLWPRGPLVGLGLWNSIPGTVLVEGSLFGGGLWLYQRATSAQDRTGTVALAALIVLTVLIWATQPWAPLPGSTTAVAAGALMQWLLLPWAAWIERHRSDRGRAL